jgi:outer membrane receptor protein involved in Fe transport
MHSEPQGTSLGVSHRRRRSGNSFQRFPIWLAVLVAVCLAAASLFGQSLTQGAIAGTVFDPTHAVVADATVNLRSLDTGETETTTTSSTGAYHFNLLKPGKYQVTVEQPGFAEIEASTVVALGQTSNVDINLEVRKTSETIEVSGNAPLLVLDPSSSTSFTQQEVQRLPSAGGDITNIAQTAPGAVMNSQGGLGNFTVNGLPATSNLFTVNGENIMDPYYNVNNSGATNLTLGQNEISEATVVTNPYDGQYGQLAGAQVTLITKSGTNSFHGNAQYWWNGRSMNANDWLNNFDGTPRPFANANQWAGGFGGPIRKNSTFFYVDTEGLRFILPNSDLVYTFTPAFASAVEANVASVQPNEAATYTKMFNYYLNAPGVSRATPVPNDTECNRNTLSLPGFDPTTQSCSAVYRATPTSFAKEWILAFRVDQKLGNNDNAYFRYKMDHGQQPSYIDPINSLFDANSKQPSWDTQISETHVFGPRATNNFMATLSWYSALFQQNTQAVAAAFPYALNFSGSALPYYNMNPMELYPSGRNITQYQFIDDFSLNRGRHNFKFGANFRRYDVSDQNFSFKYPLVYFNDSPAGGDGLQNFVDGLAFQYRRASIPNQNVPIALWGLGLYGQDEWSVTHNLKLTLALRVERSSNPVCQANCLSNFGSSWQNLPSYQAFLAGNDPGAIPYSSDIRYNQHQAFPGTDSINLSPRFGFTWSPRGDNKTVISAGFGIFYDGLPVGLLDKGVLANPPTSVMLRVRPLTGTPPFDTTTNGAAATWAASAAAFSITSDFNTITDNLNALGVVFTPPGINSVAGTMHTPRWQEWNLRVQQELNRSTALVLNYVGNHGIRQPYGNSWLNAYDPFCVYSAGFSCTSDLLPVAPPVPNYSTVNQIQSGAVSNYNGLTVSLRKQLSHSISAHVNYTWSHNLDEASNGGVFYYGGDSLVTQLSPFGLRNENYGNSDYDVRHSFNADYVVSPQFHVGNAALGFLVNGWQWSGKWFWRSGLPFSVTDEATLLSLLNTGGTVMGTPLVGGSAPGQHSCGKAAVTTPCLDASVYADSFDLNFNGFTSWSTQRRNQYRGPSFFDMDMSLFKTFKIRERLSVGIGLQAYNVFNHPNFANPASAIEGQIPFGTITSMQGTPTSPYGNLLGFDSSPRVAQLSAKIEF